MNGGTIHLSLPSLTRHLVIDHSISHFFLVFTGNFLSNADRMMNPMRLTQPYRHHFFYLPFPGNINNNVMSYQGVLPVRELNVAGKVPK